MSLSHKLDSRRSKSVNSKKSNMQRNFSQQFVLITIHLKLYTSKNFQNI